MDLCLREKKFLVTGASRGLGFAVAQALVNEGAYVVICSRTEESLGKAASKLGQKARYIVADVMREDDINTLLRDIETTEDMLDGIFINAGGPPSGTFENVTDADWQSSFQLILLSVVRLTRGALPLLMKASSPSILFNTSSSVRQPTKNHILANSLRTAVIGLMRTLAQEIGPKGVRINAICPGRFNTSSNDRKASTQQNVLEISLGRVGNPHEFGTVAAFILSPVASYIHGTSLLVDGGLYNGMM